VGRLFRLVLIVIALVVALSLPMHVQAARPELDYLDNRIVVVNPLDPVSPDAKILIQATSLPHNPHYYVLTISNLSPWTIKSLQMRDRYLHPDPDLAERMRLWLAPELGPEQSVSVVFKYDEGPIEEGCHQLEVAITSNLLSVLMDCSPAGNSTIWEVLLPEEVQSQLALPPLTVATAQGRSKAGLHVSRNGDPAVMEFVRTAQPAVIVALDDLDWLREVKQVSPSTITLGRLTEGNQAMTGDPKVVARRFVAQYTERYRAATGVDYWLGWNEPVITTIKEMNWYAAFEAERVRLMADLGLKTAIGNFSVGVPEASLYHAFLPAVAAAKQYGGVFSLHEYSAPTMRDGINAAIPGTPTLEGAGALTLRYRYWYDVLLQPADLVIPLVITEAGIDGGVLGQDSMNRQGWRSFTLMDNAGAATPSAVAGYLEQLSWYDNELRRDPYVIGFAIFNAGIPGEAPWQSYDITEILPQLAGMVNSKS